MSCPPPPTPPPFPLLNGSDSGCANELGEVMSERGPLTLPVESDADTHLTSLEEGLVEEHVRGHFPSLRNDRPLNHLRSNVHTSMLARMFINFLLLGRSLVLVLRGIFLVAPVLPRAIRRVVNVI